MRVTCDAPAGTRLSLVQCQHFDVKRVICVTPFNTLGKQNTLAPRGVMCPVCCGLWRLSFHSVTARKTRRPCPNKVFPSNMTLKEGRFVCFLRLHLLLLLHLSIFFIPCLFLCLHFPTSDALSWKKLTVKRTWICVLCGSKVWLLRCEYMYITLWPAQLCALCDSTPTKWLQSHERDLSLTL